MHKLGFLRLLLTIRMLIIEIVSTPSLPLFLHQNPLPVQASVTPSGAPQAAIVAFAVTDQFELIVDTLDS